MNEYLKRLNRELRELDALRNTGAATEEDLARRRDVIVAIHDEHCLIAKWNELHAEAMLDPTGQDLDVFYGEG